MKAWKLWLTIGIICCLLVSTVAVVYINGRDTRAPLHLILNDDGSYGGSLSKELYGEGAPLNGEYDVTKSDYYTVNNDFYEMTSTEERVIFPHFSSYQQTMQDSSGLACLLMLLHYMGEDVKTTYNELALVKRYEEVNGTTVYGNGTTAAGLIALVNDLNLGYTAEDVGVVPESKNGTKTFLQNCIKEGKFVFVRYQSPVGYGWKIVIGYDTLGTVRNTRTEEYTDAFGDDVLIFAEPYDGFDHRQDGYATERVQDFQVWWRDMAVDGTVNETYSYVVVDPHREITFDYQPVDETVKQKLYKLHLPLNPDGTYGGTRDYDKYGSITSGRGWWNHTESNYYKINDFYNMGSKGSRVMLKNYTILQQTMHSSCGICAVGSILKYYGTEEDSYYDLEVSYLNEYEEVNRTQVKGKGSTVLSHTLALANRGYTATHNSTAKGTTPTHTTYESYAAFMRSQLLEGRPVAVSTFLGSGHFIVVIGFDNMGTDYIYDDVIVTADPCDYWDGYQDGYNVFPATKFFRQHTNSKYNALQNYLVIDKK